MDGENILKSAAYSSPSYQNAIIRKNENNDNISSQGTSNQMDYIQPSYQQLDSQIKRRIRKEIDSDIKHNSGHWTQLEHQVYVEFLEKHRTTTMQNQQNRKNNKIFKLMSQTIGTRSPSQCRSHHQKFNPYTAAGQKRIKKSKKRSSIHQNAIQDVETQHNITNTIEPKQYFTPEIKPILTINLNTYLSEQMHYENIDYDDYHCIGDERYSKLKVRRYSSDYQEDSFNQYNNHLNYEDYDECYQ